MNSTVVTSNNAVENRTGRSIDEERRLDRFERVLRPFGVMVADTDPIHPVCVYRLDLAEFMKVQCQSKICSSDTHLNPVYAHRRSRNAVL